MAINQLTFIFVISRSYDVEIVYVFHYCKAKYAMPTRTAKRAFSKRLSGEFLLISMANKLHDDIYALYQKCMTGEDGLTASEVLTCARSPFAAHCSYHVSRDEMDAKDAFMQQLAESGKIHEAEVVAEIMPDAEPEPFVSPEEGFVKALYAMFVGDEHLHDAPLYFKPAGMRGAPDMLERMEGRSIFGDYYYEVREIKSARRIKDEHIIQAAFYNKLLGLVQLRTPQQFGILNMDHQLSMYEYAEYEHLLTECIANTASIKRGDIVPPAIYGYAGQYPWTDYANKTAIKNNDITQISGISIAKRQQFIDAGYHSMPRIAAASPDDLCTIKNIGSKKATSIRANAEALVTGRPVRLDKVPIPDTSTAIYLDLEGTIPTLDEEASDYLIGVMVDGKYRGFVAADLGGEQAMMEEFLEYLGNFDDYILYHWAPYEKTHLRAMAERYELGTDYEAHLYDLCAHAKKSWSFPVPGMSIKPVAKWMGFAWQHDDVGALTSIGLYHKYEEEQDREAMQKVLDYNKDDCEAMTVVMDWLVEHQ